MQLIELVTNIAAPPERCFLLSRSASTSIKPALLAPASGPLDGVTQCLIGPNQTVTWQGRRRGPEEHWDGYLNPA